MTPQEIADQIFLAAVKDGENPAAAARLAKAARDSYVGAFPESQAEGAITAPAPFMDVVRDSARLREHIKDLARELDRYNRNENEGPSLDISLEGLERKIRANARAAADARDAARNQELARAARPSLAQARILDPVPAPPAPAPEVRHPKPTGIEGSRPAYKKGHGGKQLVVLEVIEDMERVGEFITYENVVRYLGFELSNQVFYSYMSKRKTQGVTAESMRKRVAERTAYREKKIPPYPRSEGGQAGSIYKACTRLKASGRRVTHRAVADLLSFHARSESIHNRIREWKNGDHRYLAWSSGKS